MCGGGGLRRNSKNRGVCCESSVSSGRFLERLEHTAAFSGFLSKQNSKPKKQDCMQTYIFLTIDNSVHQLAYRPAYFYCMQINTMVIIMNKLRYRCRYDRLKYGLFIDSSLTAPR